MTGKIRYMPPPLISKEMPPASFNLFLDQKQYFHQKKDGRDVIHFNKVLF
jgi:hypothetical protein